MSRSLLASLFCSLALMACGDDGGGGSSADCGNDEITGSEQCDDGNTTSGDGCDSTCRSEVSPLCGNGTLDGSEVCDDRNSNSADGCTNCTVDQGFTCQGTPSVCVMGDFPIIPDGSCAMPFSITLADNGSGVFVGTATGDTTTGADHAPDAVCNGGNAGGGNDLVYSFTVTETKDVLITGPGPSDFDVVLRLSRAACDVGMQVPDDIGDGCADGEVTDFAEELFFTGLPAGTYYLTVDGYESVDNGAFTVTVSAETSTCGDGVIDIDEECDDGGNVNNDGCSAGCVVEFGYICDGEPSVCTSSCGDGFIDDVFFEECDDGDADPADGCNATCQIEPGYVCIGTPSTCAMTCGNNAIDAGEECDDGDATGGDGCSDNCQAEPGYACAGTPSVCANTCGNDVTNANEECDDGGLTNGDGCTDNCKLQTEFVEVETNDTTPQVIAVHEGDNLIRGSFSAAGDVDLYSITLTAPAYVEAETYNTIDALFGPGGNYDGVGFYDFFDCENNMDTQIRVFRAGDQTNNNLNLGTGDNDGDGACAYFGNLDPLDETEGLLQPGTYVIQVTNNAAAPLYMLDLYVFYAPKADGAGDLILNEVMSDPGTLNANTNCDSSNSSTQDEFVEIVNDTTDFLDITGVRIRDLVTDRHVFAAGPTGRMGLLPGGSIVVWSGGAPACQGVTNWFVASNAQGLQLNNSSETLTLLPAGISTTVIDTGVFTGGTTGHSYNLDPDVIGTTYVDHDTVAGAVGNFSPGKLSDGSPFLP